VRDITFDGFGSQDRPFPQNLKLPEQKRKFANKAEDAEQLTVPQSNTFMTVLLIVAIVIAAIVVGVLLFKVILEVCMLIFPTFLFIKGLRSRE